MDVTAAQRFQLLALALASSSSILPASADVQDIIQASMGWSMPVIYGTHRCHVAHKSGGVANGQRKR